MPGKLIKSMPEAEYRATDAISVSGLKEILRSPRHYQHKHLEANSDYSDDLEFGKGFHMLALEPDRFAQSVAFPPREEHHPQALKTTKEMTIFLRAKGLKISGSKTELVARIKDCDPSQVFWDDIADNFYRENEGKIIIAPEDYDRMRAMADQIAAHPMARVVLSGEGDNEVSLFWEENIEDDQGAVDKVKCKARIDRLRRDGIIVDVKTVENASEDAFVRAFYRYSYNMQAWYYSRATEKVCDTTPPAYVLICVEKPAPHCVNVFWLTPGESPQALSRGEQDCIRALQAYQRCRRSGSWPGYSDQKTTPQYIS